MNRSDATHRHPSFSRFAETLLPEQAFVVLAAARQLQSAGKRIIELEIGDSPFPASTAARQAAVAAINAGESRYGPSAGLPEFRQACADYVNARHGFRISAENVVAGQGAKPFQQFFCEAFVDPGDGVLVFSPYFPTYVPSIERRGGRIVFSDLKQDRDFRPSVADIERFLATDPQPKAIFLNSPHNPTGGVATRDDLQAIADLIRGRNIYIFADEPYDRMVWTGRHESILSEPGMLDQCLAAYTFSKSFSMAGWRLGFSVSSKPIANLLGLLTNTALSCVPPLIQRAGIAALRNASPECDERMAAFHRKVEILVTGLNEIDGMRCLNPAGTFYVFPAVYDICRKLGISSHGLAMYLLEGADDAFGVACLGGECFGEAGRGFLRFSCAASDDDLRTALEFLPSALGRQDRVRDYLSQHPQYRLA